MELVNFNDEWLNSQLDPHLIASFSKLVVNHSMASYVIRHNRKSVASHSWNFYLMQTFADQTGNSKRSLPGRWSVANRPQSVTGRRSVTSLSRQSGRGCDSGDRDLRIDLRMACECRELASLSLCDRKSLLLLGQLYTFCLLVCQSLSNIDVNASLGSNDKSLTTAHESKKSRYFQLVNRS